MFLILICVDMFAVDYVKATYKDQRGYICEGLNDVAGSNGVNTFGADNKKGWCLIWSKNGGSCWDVPKKHCVTGKAGYVVELLCETHETTLSHPLLCNIEFHTGTPFISMLLLAIMVLEALTGQTLTFVLQKL